MQCEATISKGSARANWTPRRAGSPGTWGIAWATGPGGVSKSLDLGTGIHAALEALYKSGADPVGAFVEWCAARRAEISPQWEDDARAMDEIEDLGTAMLTGYVDRYGDDPGFEVLATEATLTARIPIPGKDTLSRYTVTARLDGIIRDLDSGRLFSLEHKTYTRFSAAHFDLDHQFTAQVWLGQQCLGDLGLEGEEIIGVLYNGLRKAVPTRRTTAPLFVREKIFRTRAQIDAFPAQGVQPVPRPVAGVGADLPAAQPGAVRHLLVPGPVHSVPAGRGHGVHTRHHVHQPGREGGRGRGGRGPVTRARPALPVPIEPPDIAGRHLNALIYGDPGRARPCWPAPRSTARPPGRCCS
jgi:hypothetical protein